MRKIPEEFKLIEDIRRRFPPGKGLCLGIGDDAAVLRSAKGLLEVLSADLLLEGVHFEERWTSPRDLGWKSLAVNLSDLAAMGAMPRYVLLSLALKRGRSAAFLKEFLNGFKRCARRYGVQLIGGDLCRSASGMVIAVSVLGVVKPGKLKKRDAARNGQLLAVIGNLGESACGLELLRGRIKGHPRLKAAHLRPVPQLAAGRMLAAERGVSALMDVSDGLSSSAHQVARAAAVGFEIAEDRLPVSAALRRGAAVLRREPLGFALHGGEDYGLMFTVDERTEKVLVKKLWRKLRLRLYVLGQVVGGKKGVKLLRRDGSKIDLEWGGYAHFGG